MRQRSRALRRGRRGSLKLVVAKGSGSVMRSHISEDGSGVGVRAHWRYGIRRERRGVDDIATLEPLTFDTNARQVRDRAALAQLCSRSCGWFQRRGQHQRAVTATATPNRIRPLTRALANKFANERGRSRADLTDPLDGALYRRWSGALRRTGADLPDDSKSPTDQKVGGSNPSERAEKNAVSVLASLSPADDIAAIEREMPA